LEQTKFVSAEIVLILEFLREGGIVHRDLKPENILFDEGNHLKLIDFATSKFFKTEKNGEFFKRVEAIKAKYLESLKDKAQEDGPTEHRNSFVGTPIYLSPELIRGEEVSYAADMWALGIMIYQMLTGDVPFKNESEYDLYEAIKFEAVKFPEGLDPSSKSIIEGLLDKDQGKRLGCGETGRYTSADSVETACRT
jgi:serine/threonine protein kinase